MTTMMTQTNDKNTMPPDPTKDVAVVPHALVTFVADIGLTLSIDIKQGAERRRGLG